MVPAVVPVARLSLVGVVSVEPEQALDRLLVATEHLAVAVVALRHIPARQVPLVELVVLVSFASGSTHNESSRRKAFG
jgi:hypothetical protein